MSKATKSSFYQKNPERAKEIARLSWRRRRDTDPTFLQRQVEKNRNWRRKNPEKVLFQEARKRAKVKNLDFSIELSDIIIPEVCPVLKTKLILLGENPDGKGGPTPNSPTLDRVDSSKGYAKGNVRVISWRANKLKSDATLEELELLVAYLRK